MLTPAQKDFEKIIRPLCHRHPLWRAFADFCELAALSYANVVFKDPAREERYLKILAAYEPEEQAVFPKLLGLTVLGLEDLDCDFLGELFMGLELSSHWHGQFFTPMAICRMMAELEFDDETDAIVAHRGFVTVSEPACGAGALCIGVAAALLARKHNPQEVLHVVAQDKDATAAHMCFVQLALLGIPAQVVIGDTLRMTCDSVWATPAHHLGMWSRKLARGYALGTPAAAAAQAPELVPEPAHAPAPAIILPAVPARAGQLALFDLPAPARKRGAA